MDGAPGTGSPTSFLLFGKVVGMRRKRRSAVMLLITFCTLMLCFAGCSAGHSSSGNRNSQTAARLLLRASPTATSSPTTGAQGTYLGKAPNQHAWIGLSSTGKQFTAFVTDGTPEHVPTFAQWFRGPLTNNTANATATTKGGQARLQAMLTGTQAIGTITLAGGKSLSFTANALATSSATPTPTSSATPQQTPSSTPTETATPEATASATPTGSLRAGLYRGERTINGAQYVAGWIVMPEDTGATPGGPGTPEAGSPTATTTATATATTTVTPAAAANQGAAIINEKTSALQLAPTLTAQDLSAGRISVPTLGAFNLLECRPSFPC